MVHSLVEAYGLLKSKDVTVLSPRKATTKELSERYRRVADGEEDGDCEEDSYEYKLREYGLVYDCRVFERLGDYVGYVAGSTIEAASVLADDLFDVAIHWDGGKFDSTRRHHASKDQASGFCYVNDIVLGIMTLQKEFKKVVYIDLDVHHGDGVEKAFQYSDKVLTVSLHHFAKGFFPGTGDGNRHNLPQKTKAVVNVPLQSGLTGERLFHVFESLVAPVVTSFGPAAVVLQCGVDGGYKNTSAARCYAYLTGLVIGEEIPDDIPEHPYFEKYGPEFTLHLDSSRKPDMNTDEYIKTLGELVKEQASSLSTD
ncbi:Histone deacetylase 8 [Actinomortierella ambigua]|nr:Histone deacetylase 8 [Actinomortierella ambigua]